MKAGTLRSYAYILRAVLIFHRLEFFRGKVRSTIAFAFSQIILIYNWRKSKRVRKMGKRKITNEGNLDSMILPSSNDVLGMAVKMLGAERITVKCQDAKNGYAELGEN